MGYSYASPTTINSKCQSIVYCMVPVISIVSVSVVVNHTANEQFLSNICAKLCKTETIQAKEITALDIAKLYVYVHRFAQI